MIADSIVVLYDSWQLTCPLFRVLFCFNTVYRKDILLWLHTEFLATPTVYTKRQHCLKELNNWCRAMRPDMPTGTSHHTVLTVWLECDVIPFPEDLDSSLCLIALSSFLNQMPWIYFCMPSKALLWKSNANSQFHNESCFVMTILRIKAFLCILWVGLTKLLYLFKICVIKKIYLHMQELYTLCSTILLVILRCLSHYIKLISY